MVDHVEIRIQLTTNAFHDDQGLGQQHEVCREVDTMMRQYFDKVGQKFADLDLLEGEVVVVFDKVMQVSPQIFQVRVVG